MNAPSWPTATLKSDQPGEAGQRSRTHPAEVRCSSPVRRDLQICAHPIQARCSELLHSLSQQLLVDFARQHSVHPQVRGKPGARKLNDIKTWKDDPAGVEKASEEIKTRYAQLFKV